jgi:ketol-acid reductoisomerase
MAQPSEPRFVQEAEADLGFLAGRRIAVIGYGNLGRPLSLNMRDSGLAPIIVGELPGPARERALADGFPVEPAGVATAEADIVFVLVSDEAALRVYQEELSPALRPGSSLVFASGFSLAFGRIQPAPSLDVLLIAPRMMGVGIRDLYQQGLGFPSFISLDQDATGRGWPVLCALAKAVGSLRAGALVISAAQEAHLDLFVEQTVGPDLAGAILAAFQVGVEAGLPPEALLLELYMSGEMGRSFQAMADLGFFQQVKLHGFTAAYGGMIRFMGLDRESRERSYRQVWREISEGAFADALRGEVDSGFPSQAILDEMVEGDNPISRAEKRLRGMMRLGKACEDGG